MASSSKKKTTMAKLNRERALRERRELKKAKKAARKLAAAEPTPQPAASAGALVDQHEDAVASDGA